MIIPFLGGAGPGRSVNSFPLRRVNLYPEIVQRPGMAASVQMLCTPGLTLFANLGVNPVRGQLRVGDLLYVVTAGTFYEVNSAGTATARGTIGTTTGYVSMATNGTQIMLVDGTNGYVYTIATTTLSAALGAPFNTFGAKYVVFANGYFAVPKNNSARWYISAQYDGNTWDALDFATAEALPDNLVTLFTDNGQVWLLGENTVEIWFNLGAADFPFQPVSGANIEWGIAAARSIAKLDNRIAWLANPPLGGGPQAVINNGYNVQRISTHAIEYEWSTYSTTADAVAYSYVQEGHYFYVLTFPTGNATWVYDAATQEWHERSSNSLGVGRHRGDNYSYFNGKHILGDYASGKLYSMELGVYDENGETLRSEVRVKVNSSRGNRFQHHRLTLEMEAGVGLASGQGSDPQVMLSWSDDGGHTYGNEHWRSLGAIGEYKWRTFWSRLGASRDRVYKLAITDPVKRVIITADLDAQEMAS